MMKFLRSQSQTVLVIVLGVIGIGFLFYGNAGQLLTTGANRASSDYGSIDGSELSVAQLYDSVRTTRDALVMSNQAQRINTAQLAEAAWQRLLLLNEADKLHIQVTDQQILDIIHAQALFQKNGVYDPETYKQRLLQMKDVFHVPTDPGVDPLTSTAGVLITVIRNNLRIAAVSQALLSGVRSSARDVSTKYDDFYGPTTLSYITFDPKSFLTSVQVSPADIEAAYKSDPQNPAYRTAEKRKIDYVLFMLTPEQMKLPDAEKKAAKDALGEKATKFVLSFIPDPGAAPGAVLKPADFVAEAKKQSLAPETTGFFTADSTPAGVPPSPGFNRAAFALNSESPISKAVELQDGVAVAHLVEIQPSELRPLEEVKPVLLKQLQQTHSVDAARIAGENASKALKDAVAKGADFKTAAAALKLKVESVASFVPFEAARNPKMQNFAMVATSLKQGEVSESMPSQADGTYLVAHLDTRAKPDPAGLKEFETRVRTSDDQQIREAVFNDWAQWKTKQHGTHKPAHLEEYGSIE